ncbi:DnaJ central domain [Rhizoctonia solani]|uniref:DnaJ central domain n=1 Tax=Rhizoctonia solani TaxID=456999 RepID=A0A8H7IJ20_9AGAM|nr:DnaJ central domain [Rhizoctonia solani]
MVKETKFYDLLEVSPDCSDADLKKAFRKKALRLHPDKGGDPDLFKEVSHAYEVLADSQKRAAYDRFGEAGLQDSGMPSDHQDLFSQLFGGGGGFFGGGGSRNQGPRKGKDLHHRVAASLEDLYKGKVTKLALTRHVICSKCSGKGGKEGAVRKCGGCQGRGQPCGECDGTGEVINQKDRCKTCNGKKVVSERKFLEVHIDKGMKGGQPITFAGESDQAPGVEPGCNDLYAEVELDLLTALGGGSFSILHLDDRALNVPIHPGEVIKPGSMKVIPGQGMPSHRHHEPADSHPPLEAALPAREPPKTYPKEIHVEEVDMADLDARQQEQAQRSQDAMDEDDDEQPRVQCANQ